MDKTAFVRLGLEYCIIYAVTAIGFAILEAVLIVIFGNFSMPGIGATMAAAMIAAQRYARRAGALPAPGYNWRIAAFLTAITGFVSLLLWLLIILASGGEGGAAKQLKQLGDPEGIPASVFAFSAIFVIGLNLLLIRFLFPFTVKATLKADSKKA